MGKASRMKQERKQERKQESREIDGIIDRWLGVQEIHKAFTALRQLAITVKMGGRPSDSDLDIIIAETTQLLQILDTRIKDQKSR